MKQKIIYCVLFVAAMYLPASSKECGNLFKPAAAVNLLPVQPVVHGEAPEISLLPVSLFSRLLLKM